MKTKPEFIYLTQEDVVATGVGMKEALRAVEDALKLQSQRKVTFPSKSILDLGERERGRINAMPAYVAGDYEMCGIKWIAGFPGNPRNHGIPRAHALTILNDSDTGVPVAVMDATYLSAMRTGAATGVGVKYLARPNSRCLGIIGCGIQSRTQLMAVAEVLPGIERVQAYDLSKEAAERFCRWISTRYGIEAFAADGAEGAVRGADVVITATVADEPIVRESWLKEGVLCVHIGSYQEEEEAVILSADKIVVDNWPELIHRRTPLLARMHLAGKVHADKIWAELGDVVLGRKAGRETDCERIYFAPLGLAIEDVAIATLACRKAEEMGIGRRLPLWKNPVDWME